jgi:hypothetical protein
MKANSRDLNTRPRPSPASSGGLMNAHFDLVSLFLAKSQFQDLREYMSRAQVFVVQQQLDFRKRVGDYIVENALEGDDRDEYYSSHEDDYDQLYSQFPRIVFSSTLLMACALFESLLVDLCKGFEHKLPTPKKWNTLKTHHGIMKSAAFLKLNYGIDLTNYSHWEQVKNYFEVRNCIVHAGGDISNMQPKQANLIRRIVQTDDSLKSDNPIIQPEDSSESNIPIVHLVVEYKFVSVVIDIFGDIWPLLETACIQNEIVGPHYWP